MLHESPPNNDLKMPGCRHPRDPAQEEGADRARGRANPGLASALRAVRAPALLQG